MRHKHNIYICHAAADADIYDAPSPPPSPTTTTTIATAYILNVANSWRPTDVSSRLLLLSVSSLPSRTHKYTYTHAVSIRFLHRHTHTHTRVQRILYSMDALTVWALVLYITNSMFIYTILVPKAWLGIPKPPSPVMYCVWCIYLYDSSLLLTDGRAWLIDWRNSQTEQWTFVQCACDGGGGDGDEDDACACALAEILHFVCADDWTTHKRSQTGGCFDS